MDQNNTIEDLKRANMALAGMLTEAKNEFESEKVELMEKMEEVTTEKEALEEELKEQYEHEFADRVKTLEDKERRVEAEHHKTRKKLELEKAEIKVKLEGEKMKEIDDLRKRIDHLESQVDRLSKENTEKDSKIAELNDDMRKSQRAYNGLETEYVQSTAKLKALKAEYQYPEMEEE